MLKVVTCSMRAPERTLTPHQQQHLLQHPTCTVSSFAATNSPSASTMRRLNSGLSVIEWQQQQQQQQQSDVVSSIQPCSDFDINSATYHLTSPSVCCHAPLTLRLVCSWMQQQQQQAASFLRVQQCSCVFSWKLPLLQSVALVTAASAPLASFEASMC
jgi:hypothetical protein